MAAILSESGMEISNAGAEPGAGGDLIRESSTAAFTADVIEASAQVPVLVDFWAPWCGPCKQLGPLLEKLVREYSGAVRLVKVNVDENQELAAGLRIQSIPMVFAFKDGRPVDAFTGALPESQLRQFIERLTGNTGSPLENALDGAKAALEAGDTAAAAEVFGRVLAAEPENTAAAAGLARCHLAAGEIAQANGVISALPPAAMQNAEIQAVLSAIELVEAGRNSGEADTLAAKVEADPGDHQARYDLAVALYANGRAEDAIDALLEIIRRDRTWNEEAARHQLIKIFDALGGADPVTVAGRRRLSSLLFS